MRRFGFVMPAAALVLGGVGYVFRSLELLNMESGASGPDAKVLMSFSVAAGIVFLIVSILCARRFAVNGEFPKAFGSASVAGLLVQILLGAAFMADGVICALSPGLFEGYSIAVQRIFGVLGAVSGAAVAMLALYGYKGGRKGGWAGLFSVIPALFLCMWIVMVYRSNATNPDILSFGYDCLAIAAAAFAFYYWAGYVYGRRGLFRTMFSSLAAIYLLPVMAAGLQNAALIGLTALLTVILCVNTCIFISNFQPKGGGETAGRGRAA